MNIIDAKTAQLLRFPKVGDKVVCGKFICKIIHVEDVGSPGVIVVVEKNGTRKEMKRHYRAYTLLHWILQARAEIKHGSKLVPAKGKRG